MDNCTLHRISYEELRNNVKIPFDDSYHMFSDYLTSAVCETLLANPNLTDDSKSAINLVIRDGSVVGRNMLMPTRLKIGDETFTVQTGGSYEINDKFRGRGLGFAAFEDSIMKSEFDVYIGQLYSTAAIAIVKKLGLVVFELPSFYKLCSSRAVLEAKGLNGFKLNLCTAVADCVLKLIAIPNLYKIKRLKRKFIVKKLDIVPEWVNDLTLHDGHAFMEVHDDRWLQWCLDNRFTTHPQDKQEFYAVYDRKNNPKGFFMTKERFEENQGIYKKITRGTIVEWGSYDESELSEVDLNLLAISSFSSNVDNITTVLSGTHSDKDLKKLGFIRHGDYHMTIKPGSLAQLDISDQSKWRIRYGGCNTIVF